MKGYQMALDSETTQAVVKYTGPVVGFMVFAANGFSGKGFVLGIVAGLLAAVAVPIFIGVLSTM